MLLARRWRYMTWPYPAKMRSVDDQLWWLDNDHVLYTLPETETGSSASTQFPAS
jgi:hypothetical protein